MSRARCFKYIFRSSYDTTSAQTPLAPNLPEAVYNCNKTKKSLVIRYSWSATLVSHKTSQTTHQFDKNSYRESKHRDTGLIFSFLVKKKIRSNEDWLREDDTDKRQNIREHVIVAESLVACIKVYHESSLQVFKDLRLLRNIIKLSERASTTKYESFLFQILWRA